jgi:hypothetical protein
MEALRVGIACQRCNEEQMPGPHTEAARDYEIRQGVIWSTLLAGQATHMTRVTRSIGGTLAASFPSPRRGGLDWFLTTRIGQSISYSLPVSSEAAGVVSIARIGRPPFHRGGSASTETMPAVSPSSSKLARFLSGDGA